MFNNIYNGKRVLVFGHTGFKGSWLTLWLKKLGAEVAGASIGVPSNPSLYEIVNLTSDIKDYRVDIRDKVEVQKIVDDFSPEIIFHLAAKAIVRECLENPIDAFSTNVMGTLSILEAIKNNDKVKSAVIITSDKCYENLEWEYGYRESDRLGGKDPYSASKAAAEIAFSSFYRSYFSQLKNRVLIFTARAGNVIGGGDFARDRIVPDCMKSWFQGKNVEVRSPKSTRPWQHVLEPLSGYLTLGQLQFHQNKYHSLNGESFNFGPPSDVNKMVIELLKEMGKEWGQLSYYTNEMRSEEEKHVQSKEATLLKLCCDKALLHLEWEPTLRFEETCHFTSTWYYNYLNNPETIRLCTENQISEYESYASLRGKKWTK